MSNFPNQIDTDVELPSVNDNITEIGGEAINALKDAVINIENEVGIGGSGTKNSISDRLSVSIDVDGSLKASAITSAGLVSLPIYDQHISSSANIAESKLNLDHKTQDLYNKLLEIEGNSYTALSFIADTGSKFQPHLDGNIYRHILSHIDVSPLTSGFLKNKKNATRDNSNSYNLLKDINNNLIAHEKSDGTNFGIIDPALPSVGTVPADNYAHVAKGIYVSTSNFSYIPQDKISLQDVLEFVDNSNIYLLGSKIQTFFSNGISRSARSSKVNTNFSTIVLDQVRIKTYLLNNNSNSPVDNIDTGDDLIEFLPTSPVSSNGYFDTIFSQIKIGDIVRITYSDGYGNGPDGYGSAFSIQTMVKEKKPLSSTLPQRYIIRTASKNLRAGNFIAEVYKSPVNTNKYGVFALAQANSPTGSLPSLIVGNPRSAQTLGIGFEPDQIDEDHYNLYLNLFPTGNPLVEIGATNPAIKIEALPAIDISGNKGKTPGAYTLSSVVEATNNSLRSAGYNFRFMAFSHKGEFGIMMTDSLQDASFSIIAGFLDGNGNYDVSSSKALYPKNVVGVPGSDNNDALGFSSQGSGSASPTYSFANNGSASTAVAQNPTKIFSPLSRNFANINGNEIEKFALQPFQIVDGYGQGYWEAKIIAKTIVPGTRIETTYEVQQDLSNSYLQSGKTITVSSDNFVDSGRFFIKDVVFNDCNCDGYGGITNITVYDSVHGTASTPYANADIGTQVKIYFSSDSIGFSSENVSDLSPSNTSFKRWFEIYLDENGRTFSHERARLSLAGNITINSNTIYADTELSNINIVSISPKLKGFSYGNVNKINLQINTYNQLTGVYSGNLCAFDGANITNVGPIQFGKRGQIARFYDQSNIDYIEILIDNSFSYPTWSSAKKVDIQLFPSLQLNEEIMILGTVQVNENTKKLSSLKDERQFGNVSEKHLSTSALDFISSGNKFLDENGIISGFQTLEYDAVNYPNRIQMAGGTALVNGKFVQLNSEYVNIPILRESLIPHGGANLTSEIEWILCVNDKAEYEYVAFSDFSLPNTTYTSLYLTHQRIFYVHNLNDASQSPYPVRASSWKDLIWADYNKNLTPILSVKPTLLLDGGTSKYKVSAATISSFQRYIGKGYGGLSDPFMLGKSITSTDVLNNWLSKLNSFSAAETSGQNRFSSEVKVVESIELTKTPQNIKTKTKIKYIGAGGKFIATNAEIYSNVEFENVVFDISSETGLILKGSNISFKDCVFNYTAVATNSYNTNVLNNPLKAAIFCSLDGSSFKNISIRNCTFNMSDLNHHAMISFVSTDGTGYLENCNIKENSFTNSASGDDKRGVISIVSTKLTNPSATGVKIVNANIENNICDKNQMIIFSAIRNGGDLVVDALVPINVNIKNNICGSICYFGRQETISNTFNSTSIADKNNIINITNNNTKYIYNGTSSGEKMYVPGIVSGQNLYSCNANISNNNSHWIHLLFKAPSLYTLVSPSMLLEENILIAYNSTFLTPYSPFAIINNGWDIITIAGT